MELRSLDDNVSAMHCVTLSDIIAAKAQIAGERIWLRLARGNQDTAVEDAQVQYLQLRF